MGAEFRLLGDIEARVDGHRVELGHARQRGVLAVLLAAANHPVAVPQLVDRLWGEQAPHRARETLYNYLSRLRQALSPLPGVALLRRSGGYVLTVDPQVVDLHRDRFAAQLDCTDLQLRRGRPAWLLGDITARSVTHPLDERVAAQLMLALYLCGRQAEAIEHFHRLRARLGEELGIDPGPALQRRYEQILALDPALSPQPIAVHPPVQILPAGWAVPRQLPAHTPHFVGRSAELHRLTTLLDGTPGDGTPGGGTVRITAINGTAGVGKTTFALHWAHHAADRFPDGQLYVNLRGYDPTGTPLQPAEALRGFLDAFAVPRDRIPTSLDAQAALYRSLLANRRVLIVLDNARDAAQVRPLLPASPASLVLITSRDQLTGLLTEQAASPVTLDVLTTQDARALLARHLGADRMHAEPEAVTELIDRCARLPLALAVVAARAGTNPGFALRVLAKELADQHTRLDALDTGEAGTNLRSVFSWSYRHLSTPVARMFRLLGLHPGADTALPAAARLADLPLDQARRALTALTRAHLLVEHSPGRYTFHDLLRAYAAQLATTHDSSEERHAAHTRLFDHYLHTAASAMETLYPADQHRRPTLETPAGSHPPITDRATAQSWLDCERTTLTHVCALAATRWPGHAVSLATILFRYLDTSGHYPDALAVHTHALQAARRTGESAAEVHALTNLGIVHQQQSRYQQAADHLRRALALARQIDDRGGQARALTHLGIVHGRQGNYQPAADCLQQTLALFRDIGDRVGQATALTMLGALTLRRNHHGPAADYLHQALTLTGETGDRVGEARALSFLGTVYQHQGRHTQAADHLQRALALARQIGDRGSETRALNGLGEAFLLAGDPHESRALHGQALVLADQTGDRYEQASAHHGLARTHHTTGDLVHARHHWQQALALFTDLGVPEAADVRARLTTLDPGT